MIRLGESPALTSDRPDQTPEDDDLGVLAETERIESTGLGILGGATEQVSVELPSVVDEDDLVDDADVTWHEIPVGIEVTVPIDTGEVHVPDMNVEGEVPIETGAVHVPIDTGEVHVPIETAEAEIVDTAAHLAATGGTAFTGDAGEDVEDAEVVTDDEAGQGSPANPGDPQSSHSDEPHESHSIESHSLYDDMIAGAVAAASGEPSATTGSTPATRREAYHPEVIDRIQAVERVTPPAAEVSLTSKRFGDIEANRETADLLTADRLLDPTQVVRPEPEGAWQHFLYSISGGRLNLGDGKRARARKELDRRIAAPLAGGAKFVPVLSRKGGVGKTTVTTLLGMALADARDDRIIAVDANPDRGTLAERIARSSGKTVRDLVRARADVVGYNDLSSIVARDETRLDVLASDADPRVSEAFSDRDYLDVASLAAHYYSIVLTDTGTGIVHSVMSATLDVADQLVVVSGLSVDEARLASETLTWLETNGYADQVRGAIVVLNSPRPGTPVVRLDELEAHFRSRVRGVVRVPYDAHIAAGSAIAFRDLHPATRQAARELAAAVVEGLRSLARAA